MLSTGHKLALGRLGGPHGTLFGLIWESIFQDPCKLMCTFGISMFFKDLCNEKPIFEVLGGLDVEVCIGFSADVALTRRAFAVTANVGYKFVVSWGSWDTLLVSFGVSLSASRGSGV